MARIDIFGDHNLNLYQKYTNAVVNVALVGANQVRLHTGGDLKKETWMKVMWEFVYFYVALTRDHGLAESDATRREQVGDKLTSLLVPALVDYLFEDIHGDENESFKTYYLAELAQRMQRYEKCRAVLPGDGDVKPEWTALGVFGRGVADLVGREEDTAVMMLCHSHVMDSIRVLNLDIFAAMS
jgi:hypothetical protein